MRHGTPDMEMAGTCTRQKNTCTHTTMTSYLGCVDNGIDGFILKGEHLFTGEPRVCDTAYTSIEDTIEG